MKVVIGCDHAGFNYKEIIKKHLQGKGFDVVDVGTDSQEPVDFPIYAKSACELLIGKQCELGVLVCGSGIGISMAANRFNGIRCAVCHDYFTAVNCRAKDNANVIALGERVIGIEVAKQMVEAFLRTRFEQENENYVRRGELLDRINLN
jgi:ribose 5-phosphate isomerase B